MASRTTPSSTAFARLAARFASAEEAERAAARAYDAGALGLEEREDPDGITLLLYSRAERATELRGLLAGGPPVPLALGSIEPLDDADWSETWKTGLAATIVSPSLVIRPSFVPHALAPGQAEVVIDPGQAFGTGAHASTRLALAWIDALAPGLAQGARVLDVGTGSGVLAIAAALRGRVRGVAFDRDPVAAAEARRNLVRNGCGDRVAVFAGGLDALGAEGFDLVVANLLRSEALPLLAGLARRTRAGGRAVFSGLLAEETEAFREATRAAGFAPLDVRQATDASGECWTALLTAR
jgi:ribosomal protein L11 methyltransferase